MREWERGHLVDLLRTINESDAECKKWMKEKKGDIRG